MDEQSLQSSSKRVKLTPIQKPDMEKKFFEEDRPHSRPKRVILRNVLGGIFPFYWRSTRAGRLECMADATENAIAGAANQEGDNLENIEMEPNIIIGGDVGNGKENNPGSDVGQLESVRHQQTVLVVDVDTDGNQKIERRDTANLNYLDAFAGKGKYQENAVQSLEGDVTDFGSPIIAVEKALGSLKSMYNHGGEHSHGQLNFVFSRHRYAVDFIFNEANADHLKCLKDVVEERFRLHGWVIIEQETIEGVEKVVYQGEVVPRSEFSSPIVRRMRVNYSNKKFEDMELDKIPSPLFSFVDPFGIAAIPMEAMEKIIGSDREVFLNLMVGTINRNFERGREKKDSAIYKLYDCLFPRDLTPKDEELEDEEPKVRDKLRRFAEIYFERLNEKFQSKEGEAIWRDGYLHTKFAIMKGKLEEGTGLIYYMGFGSVKLNFHHMAKQAMMKITDLPDDLCFSAFHRKDAVEIPYERKSDDDYEAGAIFNLFQGQTVSLGEIKKNITLETPFVYHSRALKVLEDAMKIVRVDQPLDEEKRRRGTFLALVPMSVYQLDNNQRKYGNRWKVTFANQELGDAMELFLTDPEKHWASLTLWIPEILRANSFPMTRKELMKEMGSTGSGSETKKKITKTWYLTQALNVLVEKGIIVKGKVDKEEVYYILT